MSLLSTSNSSASKVCRAAPAGGEKLCRACNQTLPLSAFSPSRIRRRDWICRPCKNGVQGGRRAATSDYKALCRYKHHSMVNRTRGNGSAGRTKYVGLECLTWPEFWDWARRNELAWRKLQARYELTGRNADRPSIDRIDPRRGYTPDNLQWAPVGWNTRKAATKRRRLDPVYQYVQ